MPCVQLVLQAVALGQQGDVFRGQISHDGVKTLPEFSAVHAGAGQYLLIDKTVQAGRHLQAVGGGAWFT